MTDKDEKSEIHMLEFKETLEPQMWESFLLTMLKS